MQALSDFFQDQAPAVLGGFARAAANAVPDDVGSDDLVVREMLQSIVLISAAGTLDLEGDEVLGDDGLSDLDLFESSLPRFRGR